MMTPAEYSRRDVVVVGMAAWDMGTYFRGIDRYYIALRSLMESLVARGPKPRVVVNSLHKAGPRPNVNPQFPNSLSSLTLKLPNLQGLAGSMPGPQLAMQKVQHAIIGAVC